MTAAAAAAECAMAAGAMQSEAGASDAADDAVVAMLLDFHVRLAAPLAVASVGIAGVVAAALHTQLVPAASALWIALLGAVFVGRVALRRAYRNGPDATTPARWLRRWRATVLAHGVAWGVVALLPPSLADTAPLAAVLLGLSSMSALGMTLQLFDRVGALLFVVPALAPLLARLAATAELPPLAWPAVAMVLLMMACFAASAARAQRERRLHIVARLAQAAGAAGAERAEGLLGRVFEHVGEGVAVFDAEQRLVAWNRLFVDLAGVAPDAVRAGTTLHDSIRSALLHTFHVATADVEHEVAREIAALLADGPKTMRRTRPDGRTIELRRSREPGGGFVHVFDDVTERQAQDDALGENQRMLALLLANTEQGFWFIDNELRTTDANPAMCRMLGVTREELLGRTIYDFVDAENAAIFRHHVAERAAGRAGSYEIALTRADGGTVHTYNNATPISDAAGNKTGAIGLFSDISRQKRAEAQIRSTGALLAQKSHVLEVTLESLSQGVLSIDAGGRTNAWNRRVVELLELPEALLRSRPTLAELTQWQLDHGEFGPALERVGAGGRNGLQRFLGGDAESIAARYRRTRANGTVLDIDSHFASDGSLVRTYTDVTAAVAAEHALRDSETRFRTMADAAPALIWLSDAAGNPTWFNQRWLRHTGQTMDEARVAGWASRLHPDDLTHCREVFWRAHAERRSWNVECRVRGADGSWIWIADTGTPRFDADGRFGGFIAYGWDITERKAAATALTAAKDEAERANRAKSEFLSRMSHELRTPMNAILGFGQLLENDAVDPLTRTQHARVQEMLRGGRHLLALINEVLDLARIEAGTMQLRLAATDVAALVDDCLRLVQPVAQARAIALAVELPPGGVGAVSADATRLRQVLLNLLSNAIKFSRDGGAVRLVCSREGDRTRIAVHDTGPGIGAAQQERLFTAFERLDADSQGVEGAGIGLALSKWLVDLMHGSIGVDSREGVGSTFWIRLRASDAEATSVPAALETQPAPLPAPAAGARRQHVLYIEDNAVNQILMEGMLSHRPGIRLALADRPEAGIAMAAADPPDLVLLDIQLPGMTGFDVLRRLRALAQLDGVPVIAVSANAMEGDVAEARRAGFDDYLTKPLDLRKLLDVIDRALQPAMTTPAPPA